MPIAFVAGVKVVSNDGGTSSSIDTTGATLLVACGAYFGVSAGGPGISISDSKGNTWTALAERGPASTKNARIWYSVNPTVGTGHTFTVTGTNCFNSVFFSSFSGVATSSPLDANAGVNSVDGAGGYSAALTIAEANELVIAGWCHSSASATASAFSGWTLGAHNAATSGSDGNFGGGYAYQIQTTATNISSLAQVATLSTSETTTSASASFKAGASAPTLTSPTGAATGSTTASAGATIDAVSGSGSRIMYALARIGGSAASSATIISTGTQLAVTTAGAKSVPLTGLTPGASYSADVVYVDATSGTSNVVTASWTQPAALAWSGTYPNQSGVAGAAFVHSGSIPAPTGGVGTKTYSATGLGASGLTVNTATGQLQGTCGTAGTYNITPTTTDASTAGTPNPQTAALAAFTLTITGGGGGGDTTPPTMSAASVTGGTLSATGSITSNETGALWWKMDASATATDPGSGSEAGAGWSSQSMLAAANAVNFGTQPAGLRYGHFLGVDAAGNRAAVVDASGTVTAGAGTYTAQTDIIAVAGIALTNTLVYFSWAPNGRPGSITSPVNGSTTTDSTGRATISHTVAGAGFVIIGTRPGPVVSNDRVFAQFLTLA